MYEQKISGRKHMNDNMIVCPKCGNVQPRDTEKCYKCGFRLNSFLDYMESVDDEINGSANRRVERQRNKYEISPQWQRYVDRENSAMNRDSKSKKFFDKPLIVFTSFLVVAIIIAIVLKYVRQNDASGNSKNNTSDVSYQDILKSINLTPAPKSTTTKKPTSTPTPKPKPTATPVPVISPDYIGNRTTDYDSANERHRVFWSFSVGESDNYVKADAIIHIKIKNNNDEIVFERDFNVTDKHYSNWTNNFRDGERLLGCLYIKDTEIEKGTTDSGKLIISADAGTSYFSEDSINISNLPIKDFDITIPELPCEVKEYDYKGKISKKGEIQDFEISVGYVRNDGKVSANYNIKYKMTYNADGKNKTDYVHIGYKIKDSEGVVIASSSILLGEMSEGETIKENGYINGDFILGEKYTVEFYDKE